MIPYIIGFGGGSASGKTTLVEQLQARFGSAVSVLHFDDYYKDLSHLSFEERTKINFDHPDAFDLSLLEEHLRTLKNGVSIVKPTYDFVVHNRSAKTEQMVPSPIIIVDGLLTLAIEEIAALCDLKIYVDVPADIRFIRRLERDMVERGRSLASIKAQYLTTVRPMHEQFVTPSKKYADLIILNTGNPVAALELIGAKIASKLE